MSAEKETSGAVERIAAVALAQLLTETRTKALEEAAAVADAQSALDLSHSEALKNVSDFTGERFYRVASTTAAMVSKDIRALKAEGGEI